MNIDDLEWRVDELRRNINHDLAEQNGQQKCHRTIFIGWMKNMNSNLHWYYYPDRVLNKMIEEFKIVKDCFSTK